MCHVRVRLWVSAAMHGMGSISETVDRDNRQLKGQSPQRFCVSYFSKLVHKRQSQVEYENNAHIVESSCLEENSIKKEVPKPG